MEIALFDRFPQLVQAMGSDERLMDCHSSNTPHFLQV
jgi:hypothetical protein